MKFLRGAKMQTAKTEYHKGNKCLEARENDLVELVLFATECTEDEWEVTDLVEAWMLEGEGSEWLCPPPPRSAPSPDSAQSLPAVSPPRQSRPAPAQRPEPAIQLQTEAA